MTLHGSRDAGTRITGFSGRRPVVMVIGGSQGSQAINDAVAKQLTALVDIADVIHLTGKGKQTVSGQHARYFAREYVNEELPHLYALADVVVSRAGASALSELAALSKPVIVIPLRGVAQDHQWINAQRLRDADAVELLEQEHIDQLSARVKALVADVQRRQTLGKNLHKFFPADAARKIAEVLRGEVG